ncbi:MAG: hypothetical protein ISS26_03505 [Candidatus Omnitrophica bacterium]|nr:hypothetical protein [Candidatus Omnitrophota bacterium]
MNRLKPFIPFLISFGAVFIVLPGSFMNTPEIYKLLISFMGAFILSIGCGLIYRIVINQEEKIKDIQEKLKISERK